MNTLPQEPTDLRERESTLFALACELPKERQAAFLEASCGGDVSLRRRLESLLLAHDRTDVLSVSPVAFAGAFGKGSVPPGPDEAVGQHLGRYKILEVLGEGGCGVVYVAEQSEPVRRRVAVKVIKLGMDTKAVIARFEAERQALAMMDHPNIARVFDAGSTETGRPYFVMELVRGIRITDYCDQVCLPAKDRLELFIKVCHAIQHAHQKGIIHRDIKPSNILVTLHDGVPVPKVIDFGIAKATEGRLTDATVYTQLHQFVGTPAYMSPEQAEMNGLDIDTRSDIYSLGVLLYELLTGTTPLDGRQLVASGLDGMRRAIRDQEPARPSTRLSTLTVEQRTTTAKRRAVDLPRLVSQLKGDLDWVAMKCLEKDRTRRYETANALAADLARHLSDEPVIARPPSTLYRMQKAIHRNRLVFVAGLTVVLALLLGILLTSWQSVRARREAERANREALRAGQAEAIAEQRLAESEAVSQYLENVLRTPDPGRDGHTVTVAETLREAARRLDSDLAHQPGRRVAFQEILANTYRGLGLYGEEEALREKIRDHLVASLGPDHPDSISARRKLASSLASSAKWEKALLLQEALLPVSLRVTGATNATTLLLMRDLAATYREFGRLEESIRLLENALRAAGEPHPPEDVVTLELLSSLGVSYGTAGRLDDSERLFRRSLILSNQLDGRESQKSLSLMNNLAVTLARLAKTNEATSLLLEALKLSGNRNGPTHPHTWRYLGAVLQRYMGDGRTEEAEQVLNEALPNLREFTGPAHPELDSATEEIAGACLSLATLRAWTGDTSGYLAVCRKSLDWAGATRNPITADRIAKSCLIRWVPDPEIRSQTFALAQRAADLGQSDRYLPYFRLCLGLAQYRNGLFREAEATLGQVDEPGRGLFGIRPMARSYRAMCALKQGHPEEALEHLRIAKELMGDPPPSPQDRARVMRTVSPDQLMVWMGYEEARDLISAVGGAQP